MCCPSIVPFTCVPSLQVASFFLDAMDIRPPIPLFPTLLLTLSRAGTNAIFPSATIKFNPSAFPPRVCLDVQGLQVVDLYDIRRGAPSRFHSTCRLVFPPTWMMEGRQRCCAQRSTEGLDGGSNGPATPWFTSWKSGTHAEVYGEGVKMPLLVCTSPIFQGFLNRVVVGERAVNFECLLIDKRMTVSPSMLSSHTLLLIHLLISISPGPLVGQTDTLVTEVLKKTQTNHPMSPPFKH